jgi:hypothetical protein
LVEIGAVGGLAFITRFKGGWYSKQNLVSEFTF